MRGEAALWLVSPLLMLCVRLFLVFALLLVSACEEHASAVGHGFGCAFELKGDLSCAL